MTMLVALPGGDTACDMPRTTLAGMPEQSIKDLEAAAIRAHREVIEARKRYDQAQEERVEAVRRLFQAGMPTTEIARLLSANADEPISNGRIRQFCDDLIRAQRSRRGKTT